MSLLIVGLCVVAVLAYVAWRVNENRKEANLDATSTTVEPVIVETSVQSEPSAEVAEVAAPAKKAKKKTAAKKAKKTVKKSSFE